MALFDRNIVRGVALVIVLKGVFISCMALTDSSIVCNSDPEACRYDCPPEVIQNHNCTTEKDVHDPIEGKCCPAFFKTENNRCQKCSDVMFMPDVNNCCECILCAECDDIKNNTIVTRCSHTSNTVCRIQDDPPSHAPTDCPWIESSSAPTTQVPTTHGPTTDNEKVAVNTSDPQGNKSVQPYKGVFYTFMVLFILLFGLGVLICCCLCYAHHSGGNDQTDAVNNRIDRTWKDVAIIVAGENERPDGGVQTWKGVASIVAVQPDGRFQTWKGVASIVAGENEQPDRGVQTWKGVASIVAVQPDGGVQTWKGVASIVAGENDQHDGPDKTWKEVATIVADKIQGTVCGDKTAGQIGGPVAGQIGGPVAGQIGGPLAGQIGGPLAGQIGAPVAGQVAGRDELDVSDPFLPQRQMPPREEHQRDQTTRV